MAAATPAANRLKRNIGLSLDSNRRDDRVATREK
jgi:hypothetical protein